MSGPVEAADAPAARTDDDADQPGPVFERLPSRAVDLAGMPVRRALPKRQHRTIGAWCFVDHFGPASPPEGELMKLGPHPHIGLHTVTWLVAGEVVHRDSLGSEQPIRPGQLNLMTAGRGIAHAEETPPGNRETQHGAQLWIAMPDATRDGDPAFEHHAALPQDEYGGVIATTLVGGESGARVDSPLVGIALEGRGGGTLPLDPGHEHGIVVLHGAVDIAGERVEPGELVYLGMGRDELDVALQGPETHALLLGGEPFDEELLMWWNFVARSRDEVDAARREWEDDGERFGHVASGLNRISAPPTMWDRR